jgi:enoyl-CoA hydratase/carnithine racemase
MSKVLNVPVILSNQTKISFPSNHVLLVTLNRPEALNAMTPEMEGDIARVISWFDSEPELW